MWPVAWQDMWGEALRVTLWTRFTLTQAKHPQMQTVRKTVQVDSQVSLRWRWIMDLD